MENIHCKDSVLARAMEMLKAKGRAAGELADERLGNVSDYLERTKAELGRELSALTKAVAKLAGVAWDPRDPEVILEGGEEAAEEILRKYGIIKEPVLRGRARQRRELWTGREWERYRAILKVLELSLTQDRSVRTYLYALMPTVGLNNPFGKKFYDLLEPVTQGVKDWYQFQGEVRTLRVAYLDGRL